MQIIYSRNEMAKESLLEMDLSGRDKIVLIACIFAVII